MSNVINKELIEKSIEGFEGLKKAFMDRPPEKLEDLYLFVLFDMALRIMNAYKAEHFTEGLKEDEN